MPFLKSIHSEFSAKWISQKGFIFYDSRPPEKVEFSPISGITDDFGEFDAAQAPKTSTETTTEDVPFEAKLQRIENIASKKLKAAFQKMYGYAEGEEELDERVKNIIEKLRHLVPQPENEIADVDTNIYINFLKKYTSVYSKAGKKTGGLGTAKSALWGKSNQKILQPYSGCGVDLKALGYRFERGVGDEVVICKVENAGKTNEKVIQLTAVKNGIKGIWPIKDNDGKVIGFVTLDGDGDMASRFVEGAMSFMTEENGAVSRAHVADDGKEGNIKKANFDKNGQKTLVSLDSKELGDKLVVQTVEDTRAAVKGATKTEVPTNPPEDPQTEPPSDPDKSGTPPVHSGEEATKVRSDSEGDDEEDSDEPEISDQADGTDNSADKPGEEDGGSNEDPATSVPPTPKSPDETSEPEKVVEKGTDDVAEANEEAEGDSTDVTVESVEEECREEDGCFEITQEAFQNMIEGVDQPFGELLKEQEKSENIDFKLKFDGIVYELSYQEHGKWKVQLEEGETIVIGVRREGNSLLFIKRPTPETFEYEAGGKRQTRQVTPENKARLETIGAGKIAFLKVNDKGKIIGLSLKEGITLENDEERKAFLVATGELREGYELPIIYKGLESATLTNHKLRNIILNAEDILGMNSDSFILNSKRTTHRIWFTIIFADGEKRSVRYKGGSKKHWIIGSFEDKDRKIRGFTKEDVIFVDEKDNEESTPTPPADSSKPELTSDPTADATEDSTPAEPEASLTTSPSTTSENTPSPDQPQSEGTAPLSQLEKLQQHFNVPDSDDDDGKPKSRKRNGGEQKNQRKKVQERGGVRE